MAAQMRFPISAPTPAPTSVPAGPLLTREPTSAPPRAPNKVPVFSFGPGPLGSALPAQAASVRTKAAAASLSKDIGNRDSIEPMRARGGPAWSAGGQGQFRAQAAERRRAER